MRRPARSAQRRPARPGQTSTPPPTPAPTTTPIAERASSRRGSAAVPPPAPDAPLDAATLAVLQAATGHHQAGQFGEAEQQYRRVLTAAPQQPDALHLLGVLAYQVGRADVAVPLIEQAVQLRPAAPAFRLNLGNALLALGRTADAVASYREATRLAPADPETHYNLGNALVQNGEPDAGIVALQRAVTLRPEHTAAQYNLGNALRAAHRLTDAADAYAVVLRLQPAHVDAHTNLGSTLHALGRLDEAVASFACALAATPDDPTALANMGEALRDQGHPAEAAAHFRRALARDPQHATALRSLAGLTRQAGQHSEVGDLLAQLVVVVPDDLTAHYDYARALRVLRLDVAALEAVTAGLERSLTHRPLLELLVDVLQTAPPDLWTPTIRAALLAACADDTFDVQQLATPIMRLIMAASGYAPLLAAARTGTDPLTTGVLLPAALLTDPVVLAALPRVVIAYADCERILTALRRSALLWQAAGAPHASLLPLSFRCALAGAAFLGEYAWHLEADEAAQVAALNAELATLLADPASDLAAAEDRFVLAALYGRLGALPGAERLATVPAARWSAPFAAVLREQVLEPLAERSIAATLPLLTPVADATSQAVQTMYEENPYPRWRSARGSGAESMAERFAWLCPGQPVPAWPLPIPVLVAGAGTGQHPIRTALRLPTADILAVDLSRASLAYGARMAQTIGISTITFAQADILALDALDRQFALIECAGVLHHLADPLAGWAVLRRRLRPDGLMLIALYSERARAGIVAARALIQGEDIPSTSAGIRAARRRLLNLPADHPAASLVRFRDFYTESGFRDLAMHVQEHRFTVPQLAASLETLDLQFLGFDVLPATRERFRARFPQPGADRDLACWDQFEAEHPDTFASMYQFWCRPR